MHDTVLYFYATHFVHLKWRCRKKNKYHFSKAIGNMELMHACFAKNSSMGTMRMKYDKETNDEGKK